MSDLVNALEKELHDQPVNPLRPHQIDEYNAELKRQGAMATGKNQEGQPTQWVPSDRGAATSTARRIRKILDEQSAKPITDPHRKDRVASLMRRVKEEVVQPAMLTQETMRRNPPGAVTQYMKSENSRPVKRAILAVKRAMFALEQPDTSDMDYASTEKWRPVGAMPGQAATFDSSAQIPGNFAMTPAAKVNWPLGEPAIDTPLKQAVAREDGRKRTLNPEQKAALAARFAAGREKAKLAREVAV